MKKKYVWVNTLIEPIYNSRSVPEHKLWFWVVKRALVDYLNFFDHTAHTILNDGLRGRMRTNMQRQFKEELWALNWFLYETEPVPFNLTYIGEMCFERDDFIDRIRRELLKMHLINAKEYQHYPEMHFILSDYIDVSD